MPEHAASTGGPITTVELTAYDQSGRPVEFARHLYRASRYTFTTTLPRPSAIPH